MCGRNRPRAQMVEIMIYEVFERDLVGPELIAANLRCKLDHNRWLKIVDALEEEFNQRLRVAKMRATQFKAGDNPLRACSARSCCCLPGRSRTPIRA